MKELSFASVDPRKLRRIEVLTILALIDVIVLMSLTVASMAMLSVLHADTGGGDKVFGIMEGFATPALIAGLLATAACALAKSAERAGILLRTKLKIRTVVGVLWAICIGVSFFVAFYWGILYFQAFVVEPSFTAPFIFFPIVMICLVVLFFYSIALTVLCFSTRYSLCCGTYPWNHAHTETTTYALPQYHE